MAIFVASTKTISRGNGQSAVASASYRAGVELQDERYGKTHDYSKRGGVMSADIIMPKKLAGVSINRQELWNLAEKSETRKNSRVAREWLVNLPHELDEQTRKELAHNFSQKLADKFGVIADCAIHRPTQKEIERGADARNFHAHIMLTTRKAELDQNGKLKLTDKSDCELSDTQRKAKGLVKAKDEVTEIRQLWERLANEKLLAHGHDLIDSRSYKEQGIDILPQVKMGKNATHLERDGKKTLRGEINRAIAERNNLVWSAELADNQRINDKADQIIFESRKQKEQQKEIATSTAKPPSNSPSGDAVAKALAMANAIKSKKAEEEKAKALELAQQLKEKRQAEEKAKALAEAKRIEQQRAEARAQREQQKQRFNGELKAMYHKSIATASKTLPRSVDQETEAGRYVLAVQIASLVLDDIRDYAKEERPLYQKKLAADERDRANGRAIANTSSALELIKDMRHNSDKRDYLEPLKKSFDDIVKNHGSSMTPNQLETATAVQSQLNNYSNEISYSRGYGMDR